LSPHAGLSPLLCLFFNCRYSKAAKKKGLIKEKGSQGKDGGDGGKGKGRPDKGGKGTSLGAKGGVNKKKGGRR